VQPPPRWPKASRRTVLRHAVSAAAAVALGSTWAAPTSQRRESAEADASSLLEAARDAFGRYDLPTARKHLRAAAALSERDRSAATNALRLLAQYDWKFDRHAETARRRLDGALRLAPDSVDTLLDRGRLQLDIGHYRGGIADAESALALARDAQRRADALTLFGQVVLAYVRARPTDERARALVGDAIERTDGAMLLQPGRSDAAESLVGLGVAEGDGHAVLRGLAGYHFIADVEAATGIMAAPVARVAALARDWRTGPLNASERQALASALAETRFYDAAARIASTLRSRQASVQTLVSYEAFLRGVAAVNAHFYPRIANGLRDYQEQYDAGMTRHARELLTSIGGAVPTSYSGGRVFFREFFEQIGPTFGCEGYVGVTADFHGMLAGHTVIDERRRIEQYGRRGEFRYISLDRMISRDFTSWYGTTNVGGWGTKSTMAQVRQAYLSTPYRLLSWVTDATAAAELAVRIAELEAADLVCCRHDPYAAPQAVALRIRLESSRRIWNDLGEHGLSGQARAVAFIAEVLRLTIEATDVAHEGRHALDQLHIPEAFAAMPHDERELRGKFSEIAFASDPRLALAGSIIGARLDETTAHGKANRRFRRLLVDWMHRHRDEITGLRADLPTVMQLDRLTSEQLRGFVREVDRF